MSLLFAATYPHRVQGLVLYGSYARHPLLTSEDVLKERFKVIDRAWGTGEYSLGRFLPGLSQDDEEGPMSLAGAHVRNLVHTARS